VLPSQPSKGWGSPGILLCTSVHTQAHARSHSKAAHRPFVVGPTCVRPQRHAGGRLRRNMDVGCVRTAHHVRHCLPAVLAPSLYAVRLQAPTVDVQHVWRNLHQLWTNGVVRGSQVSLIRVPSVRDKASNPHLTLIRKPQLELPLRPTVPRGAVVIGIENNTYGGRRRGGGSSRTQGGVRNKAQLAPCSLVASTHTRTCRCAGWSRVAYTRTTTKVSIVVRSDAVVRRQHHPATGQQDSGWGPDAHPGPLHSAQACETRRGPWWLKEPLMAHVDTLSFVDVRSQGQSQQQQSVQKGRAKKAMEDRGCVRAGGG
jgi:hypothetical protein